MIMNEMETQPKESTQQKFSSWAKRSFYYGLLAIGFLILWIFADITVQRPRSIVIIFSFFCSFVLSIVAAVSGIIGLIDIQQKKNALKGRSMAFTGLVLALPCLIIVLFFIARCTV